MCLKFPYNVFMLKHLAATFRDIIRLSTSTLMLAENVIVQPQSDPRSAYVTPKLSHMVAQKNATWPFCQPK